MRREKHFSEHDFMTSYPTRESSTSTTCTWTTSITPLPWRPSSFAARGGTKLIFTEQVAFLDGTQSADGRERGTADHLDRLAAQLRQ